MSVTDDFNRPDAALAAPLWTNTVYQSSVPGIVSHVAYNNQGAAFGAVYRANENYNNDHSSAVTLNDANLYAAAACRMNGTGAGTNFTAYFNHGSLQAFVNGSQNVIGTPATGTTGDVLKVSVVGGTVTPRKNSTDQATSSSGFIAATGAPGMTWYSSSAGINFWTGEGEIVNTQSPSLRPSVNRPAPFAPGIAR